METNSKIEVRSESIRIASLLGVTSENILDVAKKIEEYIMGDAELPETYDRNSYFKELISNFKSINERNEVDKLKSSNPESIIAKSDKEEYLN